MTMTVEDRNYLFEEKEYLVNVTVNKHRRLIRACRMEEDDVYQELSLRLLQALDKYDAGKCPNLDAYLMLQLRYQLWNMSACSKRTGVPGAPKKGFSLLSLDAPNENGLAIQVPVYDEKPNVLWLEQEIDALPSVQRKTVFRLLSGKRVSCTNKALIAARRRIRQQLTLPFVDTAGLTREEWLEYRKHGFGASDIAVVMERSEYKSVLAHAGRLQYVLLLLPARHAGKKPRRRAINEKGELKNGEKITGKHPV